MIGQQLLVNAVLVENLGRFFFLQRPAASRPLPHGAREVTPTHFAFASSGEQP